MAKIAIVTGGSSGVGRATAISLAQAGWQVGITARRKEALQQTIDQAGAAGGNMQLFALDITSKSAVEAMAKSMLERFGRIDAIVNAAGTNIPDRALASLTDEKYKEVFDANLVGALNVVQSFLPTMRKQQGGTIVNINSIAGQNASVLSGVAYVMSKFALAGLTQSINVEEGKHNIRACSIFPGDINTGILEKRPTPPPPEARAKMMQPQDIADCIMLVLNLPSRAVVEELRIVPR